MVLLQRKLYFSNDPEGVQHFPGGGGVQLFPGGGGVQMLIFIETHITCGFPGGGGAEPLFPPLDPHMRCKCMPVSFTWIQAFNFAIMYIVLR